MSRQSFTHRVFDFIQSAVKLSLEANLRLEEL